MRRAAWTAAAALAAGGLVVGALAATHVSSRPEPAGPAATRPAPSAPPVTGPDPSTLLVWTAGGLPPSFGDQVRALAGISAVTVVHGDVVGLTASFDAAGLAVDAVPEGLRIPLDAFAVDPATYAGFVDDEARVALAGLGAGEAVLGATSAALRRIATGGTLELEGGTRLTVTGVVDDGAVGAAELVVHSSQAEAVGIGTPRFLLIGFSGERARIEEAITGAAGGRPVRFRSPDETEYLRHADLVLPQSLIKARFGEFAYRSDADRFFVVDAAFEAEHIATATLPILGEVRCHRGVLPAIDGALRELEALGLASLVDPRGYQGCWVPNEIPGGGISRHSWGIAIDLNFVANPTGLPSYADPPLIEVMERWGFISGARFLNVDPGHFEFVGSATPPAPSARRDGGS